MIIEYKNYNKNDANKQQIDCKLYQHLRQLSHFRRKDWLKLLENRETMDSSIGFSMDLKTT